MLRITTTPPSKDTDSDDQRDSTEMDDPLTSTPTANASNATAPSSAASADATVATSDATPAAPPRARGGFLRAFTRGRATNDAANAV